MEVEYINLPHADGKVSTVGICARDLHETTSQEIKALFRLYMMIPLCIQ